MKCNNCGAEISDEARFCEKCGAPVSSDAAPDPAAGEAIPAPKPLEQPLSAGAVPFVPMAPAPRAMPRSMRAPRPYEPRPGFSPAQPGTSKPKRATSLADLAAQVPPAPDPELPREQREDEAALATDQATWDKYPAANAGTDLSSEEEARDARRREREEEQRRRREAKERREQAKREERERREAERAAAAAERAAAVEADRLAAEQALAPEAEEPAAPVDPNATAQLRMPAAQSASVAAPARPGVSRRAIAAIAAVVVIAIVGVVAVGAMNRPAQAPTEAPGQATLKGGAGDAGSDPTDGGNDATDSVAVKSSVEDYSWDELSELSAQIASADSDSAAMEIAKKHNLCTASGKLDGKQTKKLQFSDGKTVTMRIAGFRQDDRADGSGKAGITMISEDAAATHYVSQAGTYSGWEGSELRAWMNDTLLSELPDEVSSKVVEVSKKTVGYESATATSVSDKLWVPSFSEVVGKLTAGMKRSDSYVAEGDQYQLFSDEGVQWGGTYSILGTKGSDAYWWLRSIDPLNAQYYLCVSESGEPWYSHLPATEHAILMGFCL